MIIKQWKTWRLGKKLARKSKGSEGAHQLRNSLQIHLNSPEHWTHWWIWSWTTKMGEGCERRLGCVKKVTIFRSLFNYKNEYNVLFDNINLLMSMISFILIDFSFFPCNLYSLCINVNISSFFDFILTIMACTASVWYDMEVISLGHCWGATEARVALTAGLSLY